MTLSRLPDGRYRIAGAAGAVDFSRDTFEDLFHAGAVNPTGFYRLLVDNVCSTAAQRQTMTALIAAAPDMEAAFKALQAQVQALGV